MMTDRMSKNVKKCVTATLVAGVIASSGANLAYADNGFDGSNYRGVGYISVVGEVGKHGNGGFISTGEGDAGGKSYGLSQFTSKAGGASANAFASWLKKYYPELGKNFNGAGKAGTSSFDSAWKACYKQNPDLFEEAQVEYTSEKYLEEVIKDGKSKLGIDFSRSRALLELAYSTSVQFGPAGTIQVFSKANIKCTDEKQRSVGTYKFLGCSKNVQSNVIKRFAREEKELVDIAKGLVNNLDGETSTDDRALDEILVENATLDEILEGEVQETNNESGSNNQEDTLDSILDGNTSTDNTESSLDDILDANNPGSDSESSLDDVLEGKVDNTENNDEDKDEDKIEDGSVDDTEPNPNEDSQDSKPSLDDILNGEVDDTENNDEDKVEDESVEDTEPNPNEDDIENVPTLEDELNNEKEEVRDSNSDKVVEPEVDSNDEDKVEDKPVQEDVNENIEPSTEDTPTLDDVLEQTENEVESSEDANENIDAKENIELQNETPSQIETEESQVIASLEDKIENNKIARLFKTTKMIMDSKMA